MEERFISNLCLACLSLKEGCMHRSNEGPWIPTPEEVEELRKDLDVALSADFRHLILEYGENSEEV